MYPELMQEVEAVHKREHPRCKTEQHYRSIKDPMENTAEPALANGDAQIILIAGMMNDVEVPKNADLVAETVKPIIRKVIEKEKN